MTVCGTGDWGGPAAGDPDNNYTIAATPAFGGIDVTWTYPQSNAHAVAYFNLYRGTTATFVNATLRGVVTGGFFYDKVDSNLEYFYWLRMVSVHGTVGALVGPASATAKPLIEDLIEQLSGSINDSSLAQSLKTEINKITLNHQEIIGKLDERIAADAALSGAIDLVETGVADSVTYIGTETTQRIAGQAALALQIESIAAANDSNLALLQAQQLAYIAADEAVVADLTALIASSSGSEGTATAQAAMDAAIAAQADADAALAELNNIASDSILSPSEKPSVARDYAVILSEKTGIEAQATTYAITTEKTAYTSAIAALTSYLGTLSGWNTIPGSNVSIVGSTFRTKFSDVYIARQALLNAILAKAKVLVDGVNANIASSITAERVVRVAAENAIALNVTNLTTANSNVQTAVQTLDTTKIGYAALAGTATPYDGNGTTIVYSVAAYPTATYPAYAVNRTRIIDKVGTTNWNATSAGSAKPLNWLVGSPLASAIKTVQITGPDGSVASLDTAMTAQSGLNNQFKAQYTIKLDVNGRVSGFGLYGDATGSSAIFNVDKFAIGSVGAGSLYPFIVDAGVVYMKEAAIKSLTFTKLRDEAGSFVVENGKLKTDLINTNGLVIRNALGVPIFSAGTPLTAQYASNELKNSYVTEKLVTDNLFSGNLVSFTAGVFGGAGLSTEVPNASAYADSRGGTTAVVIKLPTQPSYVAYRIFPTGQGRPAEWYSITAKIFVVAGMSIVFTATDGVTWNNSEYAIASTSSATPVWITVRVRQYVAANGGLDVLFGSYHKGTPVSSTITQGVAIADLAVYADGYGGDMDATKGAQAGINLRDSGGTVLADSAVKNSAVSISDTGVLSGAGGGQVTTTPVIDNYSERETNRPPSYYSVGTIKEFKHAGAIGLNDANGYWMTLETIKQFGQGHGGYPGYQYAYQQAKTWRRRATDDAGTAWGSWYQDLDTAAYTGSLNATNDLKLIPRYNCYVNGNTIGRAGGSSVWDSDVYSASPIAQGCFAQATIPTTATDVMFGLNTDPATDASYGSIDYAMYFTSQGTVYKWESGNGTLLGNYVAGSTGQVVYDGSYIRYLVGGIQLGYSEIGSNGTSFYFDSSFNTSVSSLTDVRFMPYGNPAAVSKNNPINSATASTYIASAAIGSAQIGSIDVSPVNNAVNGNKTSGGRVFIDTAGGNGGRILIYDAASALRVRLGYLL